MKLSIEELVEQIRKELDGDDERSFFSQGNERIRVLLNYIDDQASELEKMGSDWLAMRDERDEWKSKFEWSTN